MIESFGTITDAELAAREASLDVLLPADPHYSLDDAIDTYSGRYPREVLPIGEDSGGNLVRLVVRGPRYGEVWFWDHDGELEAAGGWSNMSRIAPSFAEFMRSLR